MRRKWIAVVVGIVTLATAIFVWTRPSPFERAEEIVENFYIAYEVENIPESEIERAKALYQEAIDEDPKHWKAYERLAWLYCIQKQFDKAQSIRKTAVSNAAPSNVIQDIDKTMELYGQRIPSTRRVAWTFCRKLEGKGCHGQPNGSVLLYQQLAVRADRVRSTL